MRIVFCGLSALHTESNASVNRYRMIGKISSLNNDEVIYINRPFSKQLFKRSTSAIRCVWENNYYSRSGFFIRNIIRLFTPFKELLLLFKVNNEKRIDIIHVYTSSLLLSIFYVLFAKMIDSKVIYHYVEIRSSFKVGFFKRISFYLLDNLIPLMFNRYITISSLIDNYLISKKRTKFIRIPPVCDFKLFNKIDAENNEGQYFLYCGSVAYEDAVKFIINSFDKIKNNNIRLFLVINGQLNNELSELINSYGDRIKVFSNLPFDNLISLYKGAFALLLPLQDKLQDKARFPNKVAEYVASNRLFISVNIGEVGSNFTDEKDALLTSKYDIDLFAKKMEWALDPDNKKKIKIILNEMFSSKENLFNYKSYKNKLREII